MIYSFVFVKHKTAYDVRISDWSLDVCSSDLTSPCLIRSDGRTITIEKPQFIECADGRFSAGVAGIPLRHATYSGTDLEQGRVAPSQSPSAVPTARDLNSNVQPPVHEKASA